jgi:hypothetical protein
MAPLSRVAVWIAVCAASLAIAGVANAAWPRGSARAMVANCVRIEGARHVSSCVCTVDVVMRRYTYGRWYDLGHRGRTRVFWRLYRRECV